MSLHSQTHIANSQFYETSYTNEFEGNLTSTVIITPTTGKKIQVKGIYVGTDGTSGKCRLFFSTSANTIATVYGADDPSYIPLTVEGAVNESVSMTTTFGSGKFYFVLVNYKED